MGTSVKVNGWPLLGHNQQQLNVKKKCQAARTVRYILLNDEW